LSPADLPPRGLTSGWLAEPADPIRGKSDWLAHVILFVALALRLYRLPSQSIWWDEGHSLFVASHSLSAIPTIPAMDVHPPLYFWLLHVWMGLAATSEFALRFLSVLFGVLTVALLYKIGRSTMGLFGGRIAALLAALATLYLAYSQEVRMYTLVSALSAASIYVFHEYLQADISARRKWLIPYAVVNALGLYAHYFFGFLLIFQNLYWLGALISSGGWRKPREWLMWAASQLLIVFLLAPQLYTAARQVTSYKNTNLIPPSFAEFWVSCWRAFTLGLDNWAEQDRGWMLLCLGVLLVGLGARYIPRPDRRVKSASIGLWLACFVVPLLFYYVVLLDRASFSPRYMMVVTPALYALLAFAVWQLGRRWLPLGAVALVGLLGTFSFADYRYFFDPSTYKDETRELARFLEETATAQDVIFIDVPHPLDYYYHGDAPQRYLFVDIHTIADVLTAACQGRARLFFVQWRQSDTDPRGAVLFLMDKYAAYRGQKYFRGYHVRWYDLPPDPKFSLPVRLEPVQVNFGNQLRLIGQAYGGRGMGETSTDEEVRASMAPSGTHAWVTLQWQLPQEACRGEVCLSEDYRAALYLRDGQGHQVGQVDKTLLNDRHLRTAGWQPGESALNVYILPIAPGTLPGEYTIYLSAYRAADASPLAVLDARGAPQGTLFPIGELRVVRPVRPAAIAELGIRTPLNQQMGPDVLLLGYDLPARTVAPGRELSLGLYWQAQAGMDQDYLARLGLYTADGTLQAEVFGGLLGGYYPTSNWEPGEAWRELTDVLIPAATPAGQYELRLGLCQPGGPDPVCSPEASLGEITVEGRAYRFDRPPVTESLEANFDGKIKLIGYRLEEYAAPVLTVTFYWQALGEMETSYKVFTHLLSADGKMWGQKDDYPGAGMLPTTGWLPGEFLEDTYHIPVDPAAPPGDYSLEFGFYDPATGARLPVVDEAGQVLADNVVLPAIQIKTPQGDS